MSKLLSIKNIKKNYNTINGEVEAIKDISFDVNEGDFIAIVGSSGCGKSTLLSIICDLESKTDGKIIFYKDNPIIGYMLQEDALFNHLTIYENIILGLKILRIDNEDNINYAMELLDKYDLIKFKDKYPYELSGGMKQRVALIRTLAIKPDLLLLDEAFSALDFTTRLSVNDDVFNIIKSLNKTTIMVTHDLNEAISMADYVVVLSKGPSIVKNMYKIDLECKGSPSMRRKDSKFNYYFDSIYGELDNIV